MSFICLSNWFSQNKLRYGSCRGNFHLLWAQILSNVQWHLCGVAWCVGRNAGWRFHKKSPEDVPAKVMTLHSVCEHLLMEVLSRRYICFYWLNWLHRKKFHSQLSLVGFLPDFVVQSLAGEINLLLGPIIMQSILLRNLCFIAFFPVM